MELELNKFIYLTSIISENMFLNDFNFCLFVWGLNSTILIPTHLVFFQSFVRSQNYRLFSIFLARFLT